MKTPIKMERISHALQLRFLMHKFQKSRSDFYLKIQR